MKIAAGTTVVSALVLLGLVCVADRVRAQGKPLENPKVTIGLGIPDTTFLPIFLAEDAGYFKDEGLNATVTGFRGGSDLTRAIVANSVEIGLAAPTSVLSAITADQDLKVFYGGFNQMPFDFYAVPPIKTMAEAKGKRFGITRFGSSTDALTRFVAKKSGLDPDKDIKLVQGGGSPARLAAMDSHQIDAGLFSSPFNYVAAEKGYNLIVRQRDVMPDFPVQSFFARQDYIDKNPETIKAVLRAFVRGVRLAKADKARAVKTIVAKTHIEEKYASLTYDDMIADWHEDGRLASDEGMKVFFEMAIVSGDVKEEWPREKYWDNRFVASYPQWKPR